MRHPTVHLNGTSRSALAEQYHTAARALRVAIEALQDAAPNARDYYPQGDHAYAEAAAEHRARVEKLAAVARELNTLYERIENPEDE